MKTLFKLLWYYIETRYVKLLHIFGINRDASIIPKGQYCYVWDNERNINEPCTNDGYCIKPCKYYRSTKKTRGIACTYIGFFGFDICLYDQCKFCGENE
jgi:hypothetical protein